MKKYLFIFFSFLVASYHANAQQLYLEAGKTLTSFDYQSSEGAALTNLHATTQGVMTIGLRDQVLRDFFHANLGLSYAGYGAIGSEAGTGSYLEWQMNYLEVNVGIDYDVYSLERLTIYIKGGVSTSFLLQGTQTLNNEVFNVKETEDLSKPMIALRTGLGISYPVSKNFSLYTNLIYSKTFTMKSAVPELNGNEELSMISKQVVFGALITIPSRTWSIRRMPPKFR